MLLLTAIAFQPCSQQSGFHNRGKISHFKMHYFFAIMRACGISAGSSSSVLTFCSAQCSANEPPFSRRHVCLVIPFSSLCSFRKTSTRLKSTEATEIHINNSTWKSCLQKFYIATGEIKSQKRSQTNNVFLLCSNILFHVLIGLA